MEKVVNINAYAKNGHKFVIIRLANGNCAIVNYGLVEYALVNIKNLDKKESE